MQWKAAIWARYGPRASPMDHAVLSMMPRAFPRVRLVIHRPERLPVEFAHGLGLTITCRLLSDGDQFASLGVRKGRVLA